MLYSKSETPESSYWIIIHMTTDIKPSLGITDVKIYRLSYSSYK